MATTPTFLVSFRGFTQLYPAPRVRARVRWWVVNVSLGRGSPPSWADSAARGGHAAGPWPHVAPGRVCLGGPCCPSLAGLRGQQNTFPHVLFDVNRIGFTVGSFCPHPRTCLLMCLEREEGVGGEGERKASMGERSLDQFRPVGALTGDRAHPFLVYGMALSPEPRPGVRVILGGNLHTVFHGGRSTRHSQGVRVTISSRPVSACFLFCSMAAALTGVRVSHCGSGLWL